MVSRSLGQKPFDESRATLRTWMVHGSRKSPKRFRSLSEIEEKVFGYRLGFWARQFYFYPPGYCWYFIFPMVFRYRRFRIFVLKCGGRDLLLTPSPIYPPPPTPPQGPTRAGWPDHGGGSRRPRHRAGRDRQGWRWQFRWQSAGLEVAIGWIRNVSLLKFRGKVAEPSGYGNRMAHRADQIGQPRAAFYDGPQGQ